MTVRCPYCGKPVQPSATFCIHCGEPTDSDSISELSQKAASSTLAGLFGPPRTTPGAESEESRFSLNDLFTPGRKLEFLLGFFILAAVVGYSLYNAAQQQAIASHYHAGADAQARRDYDRAATELQAATGFRDADKLLKEVQQRIAARNTLYKNAIQEGEQGKWWSAAISLKGVENIQGNYKDVPQLLQKARGINGIVVYRLAKSVDGQGSIYVSQADGGDARPIPMTDALSQVHSISPDGRWLVYSLYDEAAGRRLLLYDVAARNARDMELPLSKAPRVITARFTLDNSHVWVEADSRNFSYEVPSSYTGGPLQPDNTGKLAAYDQQYALTVLVMRDDSQGSTTVSIADYAGANAHPLATEKGDVNGAVFSSDRHYLMYRACWSAGPGSSMTCAIRLADLSSLLPRLTTISEALLSPDDQAQPWTLTAEFSRDGKHISTITSRNGKGHVDVYKLNSTGGSDQVTRLQEWTETDASWELTASEFIWTGVPGLQFWHGANSLTYTSQNVVLSEGTVDWAMRYFGKSHWLSASPGSKYAVYIVGKNRIASAGDFRLCAASLTAKPGTPEAAERKLLLHTIKRPSEWLPFTYLVPDGQTLLSTMPPWPDAQRGMYAYDLETGQSTMQIPDVTDIWYPGYTSLAPDIPVFTWHND